MKIYIGSDHKGYSLKSALIKHLKVQGFHVFDVGNKKYSPKDDYPDFGKSVAKKVVSDKTSFGIAICGSGAGICMAANKTKGARAVVALEQKTARVSRKDDDANILCLGADFLTEKKAKKIVGTWLETPFRKIDRYKRRINKLNNM